MEVWYANTVMGVVQYGNWITTQIPRGATPRTSIALEPFLERLHKLDNGIKTSKL